MAFIRVLALGLFTLGLFFVAHQSVFSRCVQTHVLHMGDVLKVQIHSLTVGGAY